VADVRQNRQQGLRTETRRDQVVFLGPPRLTADRVVDADRDAVESAGDLAAFDLDVGNPSFPEETATS